MALAAVAGVMAMAVVAEAGAHVVAVAARYKIHTIPRIEGKLEKREKTIEEIGKRVRERNTNEKKMKGKRVGN